MIIRANDYPKGIARRKVTAGVRFDKAQAIVGVVFLRPTKYVIWFILTLQN